MIKKFEKQLININPNLIEELSDKTGLRSELIQILCSRGLSTTEQIQSFLNPSVSDLYDPELIPDINKACSVIKSHIDKNSKICIYGDYDVDGVCSIAILYKQLKRMNANVSYFIPSRMTDGYGMNLNTVSNLCDEQFDLIITVDNGINSIQEVEYCNEHGVDVVITDHHIQGDTIPKAKAVVAASRNDSSYPNPFLCGASVAFKLATLLNHSIIDNEFLGLAAIATISDIVPLNFENHCIVKLGIPFFKLNKGISRLLQSSGYEIYDEQSISFYVSPRINASGRIGTANVSCDLLLTEDDIVIDSCIQKLNEYNDQRKVEEEKILSDLTQKHLNYENDSAIIEYNPNWHVGVLGIVANRLSKKFNIPAILFTDSKGEMVGSGRSGDNIDLYNTLKDFESYFIRFGGHSKAAGITISKDNYSSFEKDYKKYLFSNYAEQLKILYINYDLNLTTNQIDETFTDTLENMKPYGEGFREPLICLESCSVSCLKKIGKNNQYISCDVEDTTGKLKLVSFSKSIDFDEFAKYSRVSIYCKAKNNYFKGYKSRQLMLEEFYPSISCEEISTKTDLYGAILYQLLYNYDCLFSDVKALFDNLDNVSDFNYLYDENSMRKYYSQLKALSDSYDGKISIVKLNEDMLISLCVFWELHFFEKEKDGKCFRKIDNAEHKELSDSILYQIISKMI